MDSSELDEFFAQAGNIGRQIRRTYRDLTGEELDLDAVISHYPLLTLLLALGVGAAGGWWLGSRSSRRLPAPKPQRPIDVVIQSVKDFKTSSEARSEPLPERPPTSPFDYLERILPGSSNAVRQVLQDMTGEELAAQARTYLDEVVEPKLQKGLDVALDRLSSSPAASFFRKKLAELEANFEDPPTNDGGNAAQPPDKT